MNEVRRQLTKVDGIGWELSWI